MVELEVSDETYERLVLLSNEKGVSISDYIGQYLLDMTEEDSYSKNLEDTN